MLYRGHDSANARNPYLGSRLTILNHPIGILPLIASKILPELPYWPSLGEPFFRRVVQDPEDSA